MDKDLIEFIKQQKLMVIATSDEEGRPWACNVYYSADNDLNLFFVSPTDTKHSAHIANKSEVAFSIVWYDQDDLTNRKAVQGVGECTRVKDPTTIINFLKNHAKYYPLWKDVITYKSMRDKLIDSRPYVVKPKYMKFWNDELYGEEGTKELSF